MSYMKELTAEKFCRATDDGGIPFFRQAVAQMKVETGYVLLEGIGDAAGSLTENAVDLQEILNKNTGEANGILGSYEEAEDAPQYDVSLPSVSFPSVGGLAAIVFGDMEGVSQKQIDLNDRMMYRKLEEGTGLENDRGLLDGQLFCTYLISKFGHYLSENESIWNEKLEYQQEYIIAGENSDAKNLEKIMWRIFLLRASGDYVFYHQDAKKMAEAKSKATAMVGITGNAALIRLVTEIILIAQAIDDGIEETKLVFAGEKVPLYEKSAFKGVKLGYEEYLYLFLNTTSQREKIYRCMDVV